MTVLRITGESPFSLIKTRFFGSERVAGASADDEEGAGAAYVKNLTRLIPGEALSLYAAGKSPQYAGLAYMANLLSGCGDSLPLGGHKR